MNQEKLPKSGFFGSKKKKGSPQKNKNSPSLTSASSSSDSAQFFLGSVEDGSSKKKLTYYKIVVTLDAASAYHYSVFSYKSSNKKNKSSETNALAALTNSNLWLQVEGKTSTFLSGKKFTLKENEYRYSLQAFNAQLAHFQDEFTRENILKDLLLFRSVAAESSAELQNQWFFDPEKGWYHFVKRQQFNPGNHNASGRLEEIIDFPVLCHDDLGLEFDKDSDGGDEYFALEMPVRDPRNLPETPIREHNASLISASSTSPDSSDLNCSSTSSLSQAGMLLSKESHQVGTTSSELKAEKISDAEDNFSEMTPPNTDPLVSPAIPIDPQKTDVAPQDLDTDAASMSFGSEKMQEQSSTTDSLSSESPLSFSSVISSSSSSDMQIIDSSDVSSDEFLATQLQQYRFVEQVAILRATQEQGVGIWLQQPLILSAGKKQHQMKVHQGLSQLERRRENIASYLTSEKRHFKEELSESIELLSQGTDLSNVPSVKGKETSLINIFVDKQVVKESAWDGRPCNLDIPFVAPINKSLLSSSAPRTSSSSATQVESIHYSIPKKINGPSVGHEKTNAIFYLIYDAVRNYDPSLNQPIRLTVGKDLDIQRAMMMIKALQLPQRYGIAEDDLIEDARPLTRNRQRASELFNKISSRKFYDRSFKFSDDPSVAKVPVLERKSELSGKRKAYESVKKFMEEHGMLTEVQEFKALKPRYNFFLAPPAESGDTNQVDSLEKMAHATQLLSLSRGGRSL